eukprot:PhF_6_TR10554/c0_g1_i12/m.16773
MNKSSYRLVSYFMYFIFIFLLKINTILMALDPFIKDRVGAWEYLLKQSFDLERWGQQIEALEVYEKLTADIDKTIKQNNPNVNATTRSAMMKFHQLCQGRLTKYRNPRLAGGVDAETMQLMLTKCNSNFVGIFTGQVPFPVDVGSLKVSATTSEGVAPVGLVAPATGAPSTPVNNAPDHLTDRAVGAGKLLPPPRVARGDVVAKLIIEKIGLKDAPTYLEPFITVSVRDSNTGREIEPTQDTPTTSMREGTYVSFGEALGSVYLQTPINRMPDTTNVFFEFKHWKAKESKYSVRCWAMLSKAELVEGSNCLEIYAKPADFTAKKFSRHSVKDLYFHVQVSLTMN